MIYKDGKKNHLPKDISRMKKLTPAYCHNIKQHCFTIYLENA